MRNYFVKIVSLFPCLFFLAGCWKQHDVVTIKSDGTTTFQTEVVITERGIPLKDAEILTTEFVNELQSAGWQVEKKWISKSEPFKLSFSGHGNIRQVHNASTFYQIEKVNESAYSISFLPASAKGGQSSRSIKFNQGLLGGAKIIDAQGKEVHEIENVLGDQVYKIMF